VIWSYTTHRESRRCQRLLVLGHSMASAVARDQDRREAYILKQLQSIEQWQGSVVHEVLATDLLTPRVLAPQSLRTDLLIRSACDLARRQFSFSASRAVSGAWADQDRGRVRLLCSHRPRAWSDCRPGNA